MYLEYQVMCGISSQMKVFWENVSIVKGYANYEPRAGLGYKPPWGTM